MKTIISLLGVLLLTHCSTHSVKLGKKCTTVSADNTYEKSMVWIVDKKNLTTFESKISKENCIRNGEKL